MSGCLTAFGKLLFHCATKATVCTAFFLRLPRFPYPSSAKSSNCSGEPCHEARLASRVGHSGQSAPSVAYRHKGEMRSPCASSLTLVRFDGFQFN